MQNTNRARGNGSDPAGHRPPPEPGRTRRIGAGAVVRAPRVSGGSAETRLLRVCLGLVWGFLSFKDATLLHRLIPSGIQQPCPLTPPNPRSKGARGRRQKTPEAVTYLPGLSPSAATFLLAPLPSSSLRKAGPEPGAALEAGQVLRWKAKPERTDPRPPPRRSPSRLQGGCCFC